MEQDQAALASNDPEDLLNRFLRRNGTVRHATFNRTLRSPPAVAVPLTDAVACFPPPPFQSVSQEQSSMLSDEMSLAADTSYRPV